MKKTEINICWLRRDLRLADNMALHHALSSNYPVLIIFIFDKKILENLADKKDKRVKYIHESLVEIQDQLKEKGSSLKVLFNMVDKAFKELYEVYEIKNVFSNEDYEPYALERDATIKKFCEANSTGFQQYKDQVIFAKKEILKDDGTPYSIYTPYSRKWKEKFKTDEISLTPLKNEFKNLYPTKEIAIPTLKELGFEEVEMEVPLKSVRKEIVKTYQNTRNLPAVEGTSELSTALRFGTVSIRHLVKEAMQLNETWLNELIWREFFMMILYNYPKVVNHSFKVKYDAIKWRNNEAEFKQWCEGKTGIPIVDAGMRQLNETGWMHNRVRMIVASFLVKNLLIDWRWGEAYFAEKLLDYELSSNNGNWQWAAGSGCDSAPYFRIFNPDTQTKKFDPELKYIRKWVPEFEDFTTYPKPMVDLKESRERALSVYKKAVSEN